MKILIKLYVLRYGCEEALKEIYAGISEASEEHGVSKELSQVMSHYAAAVMAIVHQMRKVCR